MRAFRFARLAVEAERLRLTHMARRTAGRAMLGLVAMIFLVAALAAGHVAIWLALEPVLTPLHTALALGGGDLVVALLLIGIAASMTPGAAEREALTLRRAAVAEIKPPSLLSLPFSGVVIERVLKFLTSLLFRKRGV